MNILVTNNHLDTFGGSESYTYTLIQELLNLNFNVEYFTFNTGVTSDLIERNLKAKFMSKNSYDVVFANHINCVEYLRFQLDNKTKIIQTCHGIFPDLEQPSQYADGYVSISEEVKNHLQKKKIDSILINNGVDCVRFNEYNKINPKIQTILSLCHSEKANILLKKVCSQLNIKLTCLNKHENPKWNVEDLINKSDLVIGLGRSVYEAMSCGRPVIVFDNRNYFNHYGDGYIDKRNFEKSLKNNCSGRAFERKFSADELINEIKKYNVDDGAIMREIALQKLNIKNQTQLYLNYSESVTLKKNNLDDLKLKVLNKVYNIDVNYSYFLSATSFIDRLSLKERQKIQLSIKKMFQQIETISMINTQILWEKNQNLELIKSKDWFEKQNLELTKSKDWLEKQNLELTKSKDWLEKQNLAPIRNKNYKFIFFLKKIPQYLKFSKCDL